MLLRDKCGWPVTILKGRPITNFIRYVIHTSVVQTWRHRRDSYWRCESCRGLYFKKRPVRCSCGGELLYKNEG